MGAYFTERAVQCSRLNPDQLQLLMMAGADESFFFLNSATQFHRPKLQGLPVRGKCLDSSWRIWASDSVCVCLWLSFRRRQQFTDSGHCHGESKGKQIQEAADCLQQRETRWAFKLLSLAFFLCLSLILSFSVSLSLSLSLSLSRSAYFSPPPPLSLSLSLSLSISLSLSLFLSLWSSLSLPLLPSL